MWMMAGRPCKPDADFERLWRLLLPDTRFPACGVPEVPDAETDRNADFPPDWPDGTEPHSERGNSWARYAKP
jgi:hypothetical protein